MLKRRTGSGPETMGAEIPPGSTPGQDLMAWRWPLWAISILWVGLLGDRDGQPQNTGVVLGLDPVSVKVVPPEQLAAKDTARPLGGNHLGVLEVGGEPFGFDREHVALDGGLHLEPSGRRGYLGRRGPLKTTEWDLIFVKEVWPRSS